MRIFLISSSSTLLSHVLSDVAETRCYFSPLVMSLQPRARADHRWVTEAESHSVLNELFPLWSALAPCQRASSVRHVSTGYTLARVQRWALTRRASGSSSLPRASPESRDYALATFMNPSTEAESTFHEMEMRWKHPWTSIVCGPTGYGKTIFVKTSSSFIRYGGHVFPHYPVLVRGVAGGVPSTAAESSEIDGERARSETVEIRESLPVTFRPPRFFNILLCSNWHVNLHYIYTYSLST